MNRRWVASRLSCRLPVRDPSSAPDRGPPWGGPQSPFRPWRAEAVELQFPAETGRLQTDQHRVPPAHRQAAGEAIDQIPRAWFSSRLGSLITGAKLILRSPASGLIPAAPAAAPRGSSFFAAGSRQIGSRQGLAGAGAALQFGGMGKIRPKRSICSRAIRCRSARAGGAPRRQVGAAQQGRIRVRIVANARAQPSWGEGISRASSPFGWMRRLLVLAGAGLEHGLQG